MPRCALWVEEDIIRALADLNDKVAKDLHDRGTMGRHTCR